jgi:NitT/TauT family transport system substrate-binding protein
MRTFNRRELLGGTSAAMGMVAMPSIIRAQGLRPVSLVLGPSDTATIFPMVALEGGHAKAEGLDLKIVTTDAGVQTRQVLAAGQTDFAIGDTAHPMQLTNRGKPTWSLFATATFPTTSNMVVRSDLYEQGVTSPEKLAAWKRPNGAKPIVAATQIGASTWTYGSYVFEKLGLGNRINWVSGGGAQSLIGGLRTKQFDAIMAQPGWMFECVDTGWGKLIFDPRDPKNLERIFGGSIPVGAVIYAQRSTVAAKPEITAALVSSIYRAAQWIKKSSVDDVYNLIGEKYLGRHDASPTKKEMAYYMDKDAKVFNYSGVITEAEYQRAAPVRFREGTGIASMPYNEVFNFKDLLAAQKKLG